MVAVKLFRKVGALEEEYGRISFDGKQLYYDGLSSIFVKYLERGIVGADRQCLRPEHGILFLKGMKNYFADNAPELIASDLVAD